VIIHKRKTYDDSILDMQINDIVRWTQQFSDLPVYANNTAAVAAGLKKGTVYRTSTGVLMVVY
jgi:hypothetical protein